MGNPMTPARRKRRPRRRKLIARTRLSWLSILRSFCSLMKLTTTSPTTSNAKKLTKRRSKRAQKVQRKSQKRAEEVETTRQQKIQRTILRFDLARELTIGSRKRRINKKNLLGLMMLENVAVH